MPEDYYHEVEKVLGKKVFGKSIYYKLKWVGYSKPTWKRKEDCACDDLIQEYERLCKFAEEKEDEWEVEEILDKRTRKGTVEYLVKWKDWPGEPTWEKEENCDCVNLIAAYENPKLKKLWNFTGSNMNLWLDGKAMIQYMNRHKKLVKRRVHLLKIQDDYPQDDKPPKLEQGLNIGPLRYEEHWYLVIVLVNHVCVTRRILVCDPLNTLIGVKYQSHPVYRRLHKLYPSHSIRPIRMTQMDRSDVCAFYVLAAYERALFLLNPRAEFITEKIFFDYTRPEIIRAAIKPSSNGEISVALPVPNMYDHGPMCEFCDNQYETRDLVDDHIRRRHFGPRKVKKVETDLSSTRCNQTNSDD